MNDITQSKTKTRVDGEEQRKENRERRKFRSKKKVNADHSDEPVLMKNVTTKKEKDNVFTKDKRIDHKIPMNNIIIIIIIIIQKEKRKRKIDNQKTKTNFHIHNSFHKNEFTLV